jgi:hypothetical protein
MHITHLTTRNDSGDNLLIIQIPEHNLEIKVNNYGSGEFTIDINTLNQEGGFDPAGTVRDLIAATDAKTEQALWGIALVWAEPRTIAHVVWDVLRNA